MSQAAPISQLIFDADFRHYLPQNRQQLFNESLIFPGMEGKYVDSRLLPF
jgi:hypothetical protein